MVIYPAALLFIAIWLWVSIRDPDYGVSVVVATLPFGMFAAINLGGLSLLIAPLLALLTLFLFALRRVAHRGEPVSLNLSAVLILCFSAYAVFSAIILVRLFEGQFLVFPLNVDDTGTQISNAFFTTLKPVSPSNSNISQAAYILVAAVVFVVFSDITRRRGVRPIDVGLAWGAGLNITLAAVDFVGADAILTLIRTADYTLANQQTVLGVPRLIGGFSEPSSFGGISSVFFAYFATSYLVARRSRDGWLALGSLLCVVLAFSSTGYISLCAAAVLMLLHSKHFFTGQRSGHFAHYVIIAISAAFVVLSFVAIATPFMESAANFADELLFQKTASQSGLERFAWARYSLSAFVETWGLGAGVGSLRGNGLISVLLGSVGVLGTALYFAFLWSACGPVALPPAHQIVRPFVAARVAALTMTIGHLLASTTPDPGLMLISLVCICSTLRLKERNGVRVVTTASSPAR